MKQVVQNIKNGLTQVIEVPVPYAKEGQILVQTAVSLVSAGTERNLVAFAEKGLVGKARSRPDLMRQILEKARREGVVTTLESALNRLDQPLVLGYSSAGTVVEIGAGVHDFKAGDRVVCAGGGHAVHAEFATVPVNLATHLPNVVDFESGAFATMGAIALNGIRLANPQVGEKTAVIGLGLLGLITAQIMRAAGCQVSGIDIHAGRIKFARQLGFTAFHNKDAAEKYLAVTGGRGFDHVLICADTPADDTVELAGLIARDRGSVVSLGVVGLNLPRKLFFEKELFFQVSRSSGPGRYDPAYEEKGHDYPIGYVRWTEGRNLEAFVELIHSGKIDVHPLITHQFDIAEAEQAYHLITGKVEEDYLGVLLTYPQKKTRGATRVDFPSSHPHPAISPSDSVSLGILGAGLYANATFLPTVKKNGKTRLVGIASASGSSAQHSARRYGFQFAASSEKEILDHKEINTIAVLTQHNTHAEFTLQALKKGKHVYCEKPLALTTAQVKAIEKELQKKGHPHLMVGFNRRFAPFAERMKEFLAERSEPVFASYRVNAGFLPPSHWLHDPQAGGGRLIGEGCHFIDFLSFIIGQQPMAVSVTSLPDNGKYRQDNFHIQLEYTDGSLGTISYLANGSRNFSKEYCEVFSGGRVCVLDDYRTLQLFNQKRRQKFASRYKQDKGHRAAWKAFVEAITGEAPLPIPYEDILLSSYATLACEHAMRNGKKVMLSEFISSS